MPNNKGLFKILWELAIDERNDFYNGGGIQTEALGEATQAIEQLIREARDTAILEVAKALDEAGVPLEVRVPSLIGDDPSQINVPIVDGQNWVDIHKALKHLRDFTDEQLKAGDK